MRTRTVVGLVAAAVVLLGDGTWLALTALEPSDASPTPSATPSASSSATAPSPSPDPTVTASPTATTPAPPEDAPTPAPAETAAPPAAAPPAPPRAPPPPPPPRPPAAPPPPPATAPSDPRQETSVTIASASLAPSGDVEVGAFVTALDASGTCTLTATSGSRTRVTTSQAVPDATTTSCGYLAFPAGQLGRGTWDLVVAYASDTARGTSQPARLDVP